MSNNACYQIPNTRLDNLKSKVARLARRSAKLGLERVDLVEHRAAVRIAYRGDSRRYELACTWVELTGPSPVVAGHAFLARIEHTSAGNIVSRVDDGELDLSAYRSVKPLCDHCKKVRARNDTFVLRAPDGELRQIGRNCLADFLRSGNVEIVLGIMSLTEELSEASADCGDGDGEGGGGWCAVTTPLEFVTAAVAAVRNCGWVSSKAFEGSPTKQTAAFIAGPRPKRETDAAEWLKMQPTEDDKARGALIVEWVKASTDTSDYMHNLRVAVALAATTGRTEGLLASVVIAYERHVEGIERKRREAESAIESTYFGEVGKRYDIAGTVERVHYIEGQYGVSTLVCFVDANGHRYKWFASGSKDFKVGAVVALKGTVKKHEEYKGAKETVLTRCKVA
jgi:hypothetical protein